MKRWLFIIFSVWLFGCANAQIRKETAKFQYMDTVSFVGPVRIGSNLITNGTLDSSDFPVGFSVATTDGIVFPAGTTEQRPTGYILGYPIVRYNTTLRQLEYNMDNSGWFNIVGLTEVDPFATEDAKIERNTLWNELDYGVAVSHMITSFPTIVSRNTEFGRQLFIDVAPTNPICQFGNMVIKNDFTLYATNKWQNAVKISTYSDSTRSIITVGYYVNPTNTSYKFWMNDGIAWSSYPQFAKETSVVLSMSTNPLYSNFPRVIWGDGGTNSQRLSWSVSNSFTHPWAEPYYVWSNKNKTIFPTLAAFTQTNRTLIRNPENMLSGVDLTGIPYWFSIGEKQRGGGALITPKHMIGAYHYPRWDIGDRVVFITSNNTCVTNTITQSKRLANTTDLAIYQLQDSMTNITPFKLMPTNWPFYIPAYYNNSKIPVFYTDQMKVIQWNYMNKSIQYITSGSTTSPYGLGTGGGVSKDSGSALFMVLGTNVVVFGCLTGPTACGDDISKFTTEMNTQFADWGDTNTVSIYTFTNQPFITSRQLNNSISNLNADIQTLENTIEISGTIKSIGTNLYWIVNSITNKLF